MNKSATTDFGFQDIPAAEKAERVAEVFTSVAKKYDLMNDLMSMGIHRWWKHWAVTIADFRRGHQVLDLAGGTGDLTQRICKLVGDTGHVALADINPDMLKIGWQKLLDSGYASNVTASQTDAQALGFPDNHFDRVIIGFGLRNVTDKQLALCEMYRVLKPGGRLLVLEFSTPTTTGLKSLYDWYSFKILPQLGKAIANDEASYRYLAESIRRHPDQTTLANMMAEAGFDKVDFFNLSGGIIAVHRGFKY